MPARPQLTTPPGFRALENGERLELTDSILYRHDPTPRPISREAPYWVTESHVRVGDPGYDMADGDYLFLRPVPGSVQQQEALTHFRHAVRARQLEWDACSALERVLGHVVNFDAGGLAVAYPDVSRITIEDMQLHTNERN